MKTHRSVVSRALLGILCMLVPAGSAQTTASPAATSLSAAERETALKSLASDPRCLSKIIAGLSERAVAIQAGAGPLVGGRSGGAYRGRPKSALLGLVQKQIMMTPANPDKRPRCGKDELVLQKVPDQTTKAQAPSF